MKENGAAIRRPHWKGIRYIFYKHDSVYAAYKSGFAGFFILWDTACVGDDWVIVQVDELPSVLAPNKRTPPMNPKGFADNLTSKQAEMKARWKPNRRLPR